jgi:monofunctional glycosyltransferase
MKKTSKRRINLARSLTPSAPVHKSGKYLGLFVLAGVVCLSGWLILTPSLGHLRSGEIRYSRLMDLRRIEAKQTGKKYYVQQNWISLKKIDPVLREAVLAAEDDDFYLHNGIDWDETWTCIRQAWDKKKISRGGSTITQQVAKNLFLEPERSWTRKLKEALIALRLESVLNKDRILEIYLNIAEWGPGIFGAEAAAQHYFKKSATDLSLDEAMALTAVLPSPLKYSPRQPDRFLRRRKAVVEKSFWSRLEHFGTRGESRAVEDELIQQFNPANLAAGSPSNSEPSPSLVDFEKESKKTETSPPKPLSNQSL